MTAVGTAGATSAVPLGFAARVAAFVELAKVRLSAMAVFAVVAGACIAAGGVLPRLDLLVPLALGAFLLAGAGHAFNMVLERDVDERMARTRHRPLPSGRLTVPEVLSFGAVTAVLGVAVLAASLPPLATALCASILASYVLLYTPLKRRSTLNTIVGAVPGALPPVVGYAAVAGRVDAVAATLFAILFLWQIPHFLAISWRYRDDYRAGGLQMLSVGDRTGAQVGRQMVAYCAALVAVTTLPFALGFAGQIYLVLSAWLGLLFLVPCVLAAWLRTDLAMKQVFIVSIIYLPLLLIVMVLDATPVVSAL
jgi:protoheme IX farnesyltransferase